MATMNPIAVTFEHTLVPTDFSEASQRALEYSARRRGQISGCLGVIRPLGK